MEYKVGNDIIEVERVESSIQKLGESFLNRVFTPAEIEYCESKNKMKYQHYAARFAAKEAVFKAISINLTDKYSITWKDIEIENDLQGKPHIHLYGINDDIFESIDISISHCREYAVAYVVVLQK